MKILSIVISCLIFSLTRDPTFPQLGAFEIISSAADIPATPLVAFRVKDPSRFNEYDFAKNLRRHGWIVPAYSLPPTGDGKTCTALRVVVREDFSRGLADWLVQDMQTLLEELNG